MSVQPFGGQLFFSNNAMPIVEQENPPWDSLSHAAELTDSEDELESPSNQRSDDSCNTFDDCTLRSSVNAARTMSSDDERIMRERIEAISLQSGVRVDNSIKHAVIEPTDITTSV